MYVKWDIQHAKQITALECSERDPKPVVQASANAPNSTAASGRRRESLRRQRAMDSVAGKEMTTVAWNVWEAPNSKDLFYGKVDRDVFFAVLLMACCVQMFMAPFTEAAVTLSCDDFPKGYRR